MVVLFRLNSQNEEKGWQKQESSRQDERSAYYRERIQQEGRTGEGWSQDHLSQDLLGPSAVSHMKLNTRNASHLRHCGKSVVRLYQKCLTHCTRLL